MVQKKKKQLLQRFFVAHHLFVAGIFRYLDFLLYTLLCED